jgi:PIN domain nuclease of toxin-antitoxin system
MKLLLDTHIFLWYITADPRLSAAHQAAIQASDNDVYLSSVSVWEAVVKHALGKLPLPSLPAEYLPKQREAHGIAGLAIDESAMRFLADLPPLHRDPFDRMLVAQAMQHGMTVVTADTQVSMYGCQTL